jgi:mutator protein MutT
MKIAKFIKKLPSGVSEKNLEISTVMVIDDEDRLLLVRRSKGDKGAGIWETPGGHVDPGETYQEAAKREALEEVGLEVNLTDHKIFFETVDGKYGTMVLGIAHDHDVTLKLDEHDKFKWIEPSELKKYKPLHEDFEKQVALLFLKMRRAEKENKGDKLDITDYFEKSVNTPHWESVWNLGNLKKPDFSAFSLEGNPLNMTQISYPQGEGPKLDGGIVIYPLLLEIIKDMGFSDYCDCTKVSSTKVRVSSCVPRPLSVLSKISGKLGYRIVKKTATYIDVVATPSYSTPASGTTPAMGTNPTQKPTSPQNVKMEFQMDQTKPSEKLQEALGNGAKVQDTSGGKITIETNDPQKVMNETERLKSQGELPMVKSSLGRKRLSNNILG